MHVDAGRGLADLADQQARRTKRRIVTLAPEQPQPAAQRREIAEQGAAGADLAAVEARAMHAPRLNIHGLVVDARGIAQHVDEQIVAANLAEELLVVAGLSVAARGPVAEAASRETAGEINARWVTRRDSRRARLAAMAPPNEKPAKRSAPSPGNMSVTARYIRSRYSGPVVSRGTDGESPYDR